ncbi:hypothetical protein OH492_12165 [Vibrio chagasii]|nr:hypothetical protein [Vibrio chagasii]
MVLLTMTLVRTKSIQKNNFDYHLKPFIAAIEAGASSILPYYGIPVRSKWMPNDVGMSLFKRHCHRPAQRRGGLHR